MVPRGRGGRPLAHRDHGPDGPDGPEGVEEPLRRRRAPSRVSGGGSSLAAAGAGLAGGTMWASGPGKSDEGSAPLAKRGVAATVKTWLDPRPQAPPALVRPCFRLNRLWSSPLATPARRTSRPSPARSQVSGHVGGSKRPRSSDEIALGGRSPLGQPLASRRITSLLGRRASSRCGPRPVQSARLRSCGSK
jgi:hypothetical protein